MGLVLRIKKLVIFLVRQFKLRFLIVALEDPN
jgi:hypothetical protein